MRKSYLKITNGTHQHFTLSGFNLLGIFGRDLEKAVEDLSELLEEPIEPEKIAELRQKMTDKTVCTLYVILNSINKLSA